MTNKRIMCAIVACVVALQTLGAVDTGKNSGEDKPLKPGSFVLQDSLERDMPQAGEVNLWPAAETAKSRVAIIPSTTPDGAIRFILEKPVNQLKAMSAFVGKTLRMDFSPAIKGNFSWVSPTELVYTPQKGQLKQGDWITVRLFGKLPLAVGGDTAVDLNRSWYVSNFGMGTKASGFEVLAGKPRFVASLDSGTGCIGAGMLNLLYDQPVDSKNLAIQLGNSISATVDGKPVNIEVRNPLSISIDTDQEYDVRHVLQVIFKPLPADGTEVQIRVPTLDEDRRPVVETLTRKISTVFSLESEFLDRAAGGNAMSLEGTMYFAFRNRFSMDDFQGRFSIQPAPLALSVWRNDWENTVQVNYRFAPGVKYQLRVDPTFMDYLGNRLSPPVNVTFQAEDLPLVITPPKEALVLETTRNRLPLEVRNLRTLTVRTWIVDNPLEYVELLSRYPFTDTVVNPGWKEGKTIELALDQLDMNKVHRIDAGLVMEPGLKLVELSATGRGTRWEDRVSVFTLVQSTDLGVSTKVSERQAFCWVTSLSGAKPVSGATLRMLDKAGRELGAGTTGKDGVTLIAGFDMPEIAGKDAPDLVLLAKSGGDQTVSIIKDATMSNAWQFNLPGVVAGTGILPAALFSDRGVYRPGEVVHLKAYLRAEPRFEGATMNLKVLDPQGQQVANEELKPDEYRGLGYDLQTQEGAPVGEYQVVLSSGYFRTRASFRVEEYRVPTFQVEVKTRDEQWISGSPVTVEAKAAYLQGALMGGSDVVWRVYRQPEDFTVAGLPGYVFTGSRDPSLTGNFKVEEGVLNADSKSLLTFAPESTDPFGPLRYIAQAAVTDPEQQTYAGRVSKVVHPAGLYVGALPPPRAIFTAGEEFSIPLVVVDTNGVIQKGRRVEILADRIDYHTSTMMDEGGSTETYNREVVSSTPLRSIVSTGVPEPVRLSLSETGSWEIRFVVTDDRSNVASCAIPLVISGDKPAAWPRFDRERVDPVLDKDLYKVGETAKLTVKSPFAEAEGLLAIEGDGVIDYQRFTIKKDTPAITFPVKAAYAPNAFASVILIRGRTHDLADASGFETGAPAYRVGYVRLNVDPGERRLTVAAQPSATAVRPGATLGITVNLKDWKGKAASGCATVMVVDEAVLGLTGHKTPDPVALAYALRLLGVRNASSLLDLPHARRNRLEALFPGGDSDESQPLGAEDLGRKLFKSTAYWNPALPVGDDGTARVEFTMPDNLSTYRVMVVAADRDGRMGSGESKIRSSLPLMVQPVVPRFVYPGDRLALQARIFNTTDAAGTVQLSGEFKGFSTGTKPPAGIKVASKGDSIQPWTGVVDARAGDKVEVKLTGTMGKEKDSVQVGIPVRSPGNKQTFVESKMLAGVKDLVLEVPKNRLPGTGSYEVVLSASPLSELKDAVTYLMDYPNGCIEQTTSTAYPLVVLKDLLPSIGVEVNMADLKTFSEAGVKRILSFQTTSGGLAYWPGSDEPHAFATSFGLTCLLEAKKRGYDVPDQSLKRMADYLEATLKKGNVTESIPHGSIADGDTRALFVMTLGRLGRPQPSYIQDLWRNKAKLTPFGLSFLAVAIRENKGDQSLLEPVLAEIRKVAKLDDDEAWYDLERKGEYSMDSPLRTHAGALLAYSLASGSGGGDMTPRLLKGLLNRREGGLWGNTQENVFGIMAIYQLATGGSGGVSGAGAGDGTGGAPQPTVTINGREWAASAMERPSAGMYRVRFGDSSPEAGDTIKVRVDTKGQTLFATIRASMDLPLTAEFRSARNNGFDLQRIYETADGKRLDLAHIPLGTVVKVRLILKTDAQKNYVAVDDKLPAGFEPLNANLATTEQAAMGTLSETALSTLPSINYQEIRDHRVAFYVDAMTPGTWEFVYLAKASTAGTFLSPAGLAEAMYETDFNGTTRVETVTIE